MAIHFPSHNAPTWRLLGGLLALLMAVTTCGWLAAQNPKKEEEEEPVKTPTKKPPQVEEEEEKPARPHKVIKVDDDPAPSKPKPKPVPPPPVEAQTSIVEALRETKNPELRTLFTSVKVPHDAITTRSINDQLVTHAIEPLPTYYEGEQVRFPNGRIHTWIYDAEWKLSKNETPFSSAISVKAYEDIVREEVDGFLAKEPARLHLTKAEMLQAAETVLAAADRYHDSARAKGARRGEAWQKVVERLHERLFEVQRERLQLFIDAGEWDGAAAYARTLVAAYRDPGQQSAIAAPLVRMLNNNFPDHPTPEQLRKAHQQYRQLEEIFPGSQALEPLTRGLRAQAQRLLTEAKHLSQIGKAQEASLMMQLAADICPTLPDLADELARMDQDHPVLRIGVRELPVNMVPGQAATDADLRAIELMYEGLIKLRVVPGVGQRYEPALADGLPRLIPLGREFRIARNATWSDGTPVTVGDVKETLQTMRDKDRWLGYSVVWNNLVEKVEGGGDSFRLSLRLGQGYLDPMSLMTFKVMSQKALARPNQPPITSGPFRYKESKEPLIIQNRRTALFLSNPAYAGRVGKARLPRIREIQMLHFADEADDPAKALAEGKIDLALDLSAQKAADLRRVDGVVVRGPMTNRRVWFLAVNHRVGVIQNNPFLTRALALAIDRQMILDRHFRDAPKGKMHHSLNGPFPTGSWPCDPKVPAELYNPDEAKAQARQAVKQAGEPITLKLKYAAHDQATRAALQYLCTSVNNELRIDDKTFIELQAVEVAATQLREDVEKSHNYQLAYYHYDYPSEAFWLAPLFDSRATDINGSNYLGYTDDGDLQAQLARAQSRRDFSEVQQSMRLVHRMLEQKMPLIPLWQLDTFLAHRQSLNLKDASVDPLLIFNDAEEWKLDRKR
jgi:ABC-type oligopeptide transport system substrate-binding subunit